MPNTYSWWYYYVGGPIFQFSSGSIDAEKWWLRNQVTPSIDWWNAHNVNVTAEFPGNEVTRDSSLLEHVLCEYNPLNPFSSDYVTFNPTQALRDQQTPQQP